MRRSELPGVGRARPPASCPATVGTARNHTVLRAEGMPLSPAQFRTATAAATDVGRRRTGNEDCFSLWTADGGQPQAADTLLVVCDGMGGSNAGEIASRMAVDTVVREIAAAAPDDTATALARAVQTANTEIFEYSRTHADLNGMGTTCTVLALHGDGVLVAHVGDSRAYLVRGHHARQITTDHSLVAQLVARQQLTPEEARHDPRRNVVTRSVGVAPEVEVDVIAVGEPLHDGDTLVVCSDGLHGQMSDSEIASLAVSTSLDDACRDLIALANERGGPDNITVALARFSRTGGRRRKGLGRWLRTLGGRRDT
jgi:PPM family protein phosphatase